MDALSDFLASVRVDGGVFARAECSAPWGVETRGADHGIFHAVLRGSGWVRIDGEPARPFRAGDLLVLASGSPHVLTDTPQSASTWILDLPTHTGDDGLPCVVAGSPGAGPGTSILCGTFRFGPGAREALLPFLPPLLHLEADGGATASWLDATLRLLADEVAGQRPGVDVVTARLADVLLIQVLRRWIDRGAHGGGGWLGALADPALARALGAMHREPARSWTAASLARRAGMSRTVFYERFTRAVGEPPTQYLAGWRMHLARRALADSGAGIAEVAERVGYGSEAAFSRAFKRRVGVSPSAWRASA